MNSFIAFMQDIAWPLAILFYVAFVLVLMVLSYQPPPQEDPADRTDRTAPASGHPGPASSPPSDLERLGERLTPASPARKRLPAYQTLLITKCFDPMLWYADHIGKIFDVLRQEYWPKEDMIVYWVRTPNGTTNWVCDRDCVVHIHKENK